MLKTYRPEDLCDVLHLKPTQIYRLIRNGDLIAANVSTGKKRARYIVMHEDLVDFIERRKVRPERVPAKQYKRRWN